MKQIFDYYIFCSIVKPKATATITTNIPIYLEVQTLSSPRGCGTKLVYTLNFETNGCQPFCSSKFSSVIRKSQSSKNRFKQI
jgi:hypothetical protein